MLANVFVRTLAERTRATVLFAVGIAAVTAMYLGVFPSMQDQMAAYMDAVPESIMAFLGGSDLATPAGYIGSTVFGVFGPVIIVAAGATWAASAIAGDEEAHTLPLVLSAPQSRTAVALQKLAAIALALALICAVAFVSLEAMSAALDIDVSASQLLAGVVHLYGLGLFSAGLSFAIGAAGGSRAMALGVTLAVVVAGFVLSGVAGYVEGLDLLAQISPFHWYSGADPVQDGVAWGHLALLFGFAAAFAVAGIARFNARDLRT